MHPTPLIPISYVSPAVEDGVAQLNQRQDDQDHQAILDWLTRIDYGAQQSDFIAKRQEGTGQWFLDSDEFREWLTTENQTLFCPGMPGAGKTMIASIVVDHLRNRFQNDASVGVAYLYCNFRLKHEQKPQDLLKSLLKQLTQNLNIMPDCVKEIYNRHKKERTRPSSTELSETLHSVALPYGRVFIVVDALDEFEASNEERKSFLSEIFNLKSTTPTSVFATSRFIPEIEKEFDGSISLKIYASEEDVRKYLDSHMSRLPSFVSRNLDLQGEIKTEIIKAVRGMFLLAQLHLDSLIGKRSPKGSRPDQKRTIRPTKKPWRESRPRLQTPKSSPSRFYLGLPAPRDL